MPYSEWAGGPRGEPWTDLDRLLHQAVRAYLADLCPGCGWPKQLTTNPGTEHHWSAPAPTRCHACTAIEHRAKKHHDADAAGALAYHAQPSEGLLAAMGDPALPVAPPLPTGTTGRLHATDEQVVAWLVHHDLPVPDHLHHLVHAHT